MLEMDATAGYDRVAFHKSLYFQVKGRMKCIGREVRRVARNQSSKGRIFYTVSNDL